MRKPSSVTSRLLAAGVFAGPLYLLVGLAQAVTRDGFDLTGHSWSLLANGDSGWIQVANFLVTGLLVLAAAVAVRAVLRGSKGGVWGPVLLGLFGLGLVASGVFRADPMNGFPPGAPSGPPDYPTVDGLLHMVAGSIGFVGLIGACLVFARRFLAEGRGWWAGYSAATGTLFLAAFVGVGAGSHAGGTTLQAVTLGFTAAVVLGWLWVSLVLVQLLTRDSRSDRR